jgi:DNA-binding response OmpR family regulator
MKRILIVEDDVNLGLPLTGALEMQNYKVSYLTNGAGAVDEFKRFKPDLAILDVILNGALDGFDIAKLIRIESNIPILFTTSRDGNEDFKTGFSIDNTDYVRKPYRLMEVTLRIENLITKQVKETKKTDLFQIGNFSFFPDEQSLQYNLEKIHLNNYESEVMALLCKNMNVFVPRKKIIESIWNVKETSLKEGSLNNILTKLRKYLDPDAHVILESKIKLGVKLTIIH